jgi:hypothetical protein
LQLEKQTSMGDREVVSTKRRRSFRKAAEARVEGRCGLTAKKKQEKKENARRWVRVVDCEEAMGRGA